MGGTTINRDKLDVPCTRAERDSPAVANRIYYTPCLKTAKRSSYCERIADRHDHYSFAIVRRSECIFDRPIDRTAGRPTDQYRQSI